MEVQIWVLVIQKSIRDLEKLLSEFSKVLLMIDFMIWQKHNFKSLNKNDYRRNYESRRLKRLSQLLLTTHRWMMENDYSNDHEWGKIEITDMLDKLKRRLRIKSSQNILSNQKSIKSHKFINDLTNILVKSL